MIAVLFKAFSASARTAHLMRRVAASHIDQLLPSGKRTQLPISRPDRFEARALFFLIALLLLTSCRQREVIITLPTETTLEQAATAAVLTREAPPPGFDVVRFPLIDANLTQLDSYRAQFSFAFNGTFARTPRLASTETRGETTANVLQQARRTVSTISTTLQPDVRPLQLDAVLLGEDPFLVRDGVCITNREEALLATQLIAGTVLGGVREARALPRRAVVNGEQVWEYRFTLEDLNLPNVTFGDNSRVVGLSGELWVSPARNVVVRYYLNLNVENVTLFNEPLPVTGALVLRYDLFLHEDPPNISIPFGC